VDIRLLAHDASSLVTARSLSSLQGSALAFSLTKFSSNPLF
jgi:hypothetical protein